MLKKTPLKLCVIFLSLFIFLESEPVMSSSPMSPQMIQDRGENALTAYYNQLWKVDDIKCDSFRPASNAAEMIYICHSDSKHSSQKLIWASRILPGQIVGLFPINGVARKSAPNVNSSLPPKNDKNFLKVVEALNKNHISELLEMAHTRTVYQ